MAGALSEYELLRLRNIKRNHEFMKSIGKCFVLIERSMNRPYYCSFFLVVKTIIILGWVYLWLHLVPVAEMGKDI